MSATMTIRRMDMKTLTGIGSRVMGQLGKVGAVLLTLSMSTNILAASGSGTTGAEYLKIGVGAREVAMAGAVAAIVNDGHSLYWNPAGAAKVDAQRLDASYNNLYQDTNQGFISYSHPTSIGVWSGGINYLQISKIERRLSDTGSPDYTFTSKDSEFLLSYARANVAPGLALGGSVKYLQSYLDSANAHAFALDFGAQYQKSDMPWALGASLVNLGSGLKYVNATEPLPLGVKLGGAYQLLDR